MADFTPEEKPQDIGQTGPSTDIQSPYPGATKVEDGIAYDAAGKQLGPVDENTMKAPGAAPKPKWNPDAPMQFANEKTEAAGKPKPKWDPKAPMQFAPPAAEEGNIEIPEVKPEGFWGHIKAAVAGPNTAFNTPEGEAHEQEREGLWDILTGDIKKGFGEVWDANKIDANHIIPNSPVEWAIRQFDPDFRGQATKEAQAAYKEKNPNPGEKPLVDIAQFVDMKKHPIAKALTEVAQGFTSPENVAIMYGTGGLGLLGKVPQAFRAYRVTQRLISAGFAYQSLESAYEHSKAFKEAYDAGDETKAEYELTHAVAAGVITAQAATHAAEGKYKVGGKTVEVKPLVEPSPTEKKVIGAVTNVIGKAAEPATNFAKEKLQAVTDRVGEAIGKTSDFDTAVGRVANMMGKKAGPEFLETVKTASDDLKEIINKDTANKIKDPQTAADAITQHLQSDIEAPLQREAGATKDSVEPVVPDFGKRLRERLDKFFDDNAGQYGNNEQEEAIKQRIIDRLTRNHDLGNGVVLDRDPNLYEAENARRGLNKSSGDVFEHGTTSGYRAASAEAANFMREVIDEAYKAKGIKGVPEARAKEAALIKVKEALEAAQGSFEKQQGTPWLAKLFSTGKLLGMLGTMGAHFMSSDALSGALAAGTIWKGVHEENATNIEKNLDRMRELAGRDKSATATTPDVGGAPPPTQGPAGTGPFTPRGTPEPGEEEPLPANVPPRPEPPQPATRPAVNHSMNGVLSSYFNQGRTTDPVEYKNMVDKFNVEYANMKAQVVMAKAEGRELTEQQQKEWDRANVVNEKLNNELTKEDAALEKENQKRQDQHQKELNKWNAKLQQEKAKAAAEKEANTDAESAAKKQAEAERVAGILADERIAHSPMMKATEPATPIEGLEGRSSKQNHEHEHGHIVAATAEGLNPVAFITDKHPTAIEDNAMAQVHTDLTGMERGGRGIKQRVIAALGGAAWDEVHHGMKLSRNTGAGSDIAFARKLLREKAGLQGARLDKVFDALYDIAKEHVSNPEAIALVQANAPLREAGLHENHHMSPGRMEEYVKKLQGVFKNGETPTTEGVHEGPADEGVRGGESDEPGGSEEERAGTAASPRAEAVRTGDEGGEAGAGPERVSPKFKGGTNAAGNEATARKATAEQKVQSLVDDNARLKELLRSNKGTPEERDAALRRMEENNTLINEVGKVDKFDQANLMQSDKMNDEMEDEPTVMSRADFKKNVLHAYDTMHQTPQAAVRRVVQEAKARGVEVPEEYYRDKGNLQAPPERSTGDKELDEKIRKGGAVPAGRMGPLAMFHHPETGSTLALKPEDITPETVKEHLGHSKEAFTQGDIRNTAREYNAARNMPEVNPAPVMEDPRINQIADTYDKLEHSPNDPKVKASYDAFKKELDDQYDALEKSGFKFDTSKEDPYPSYEAMRQDILRNKHLTAWEGAAPPADHPLAERDPKTGMTYNEKFRLVHDVLGHAAHDADFSGNGEESAWNYHRQMFSPEAQPALAAETRGQVASFTKNGKFPESQKAVLLPDEFNKRPEEIPDTEVDKGNLSKAKAVEGLDKMREKYGETDDASTARNGHIFITPEGKFVDVGDHSDAIATHTGYTNAKSTPRWDNRPEFINKSGAVRSYSYNSRGGENLSFSVPKDGVNEAQANAMRRAVKEGLSRNGNLIVERADVTGDTYGELSRKKEFPKDGDVDRMLREIGAHPGGGTTPEGPKPGEKVRGAVNTENTAAQAAAENANRQREAEYNKNYTPGGRLKLNLDKDDIKPENLNVDLEKHPAGGIDPFTGSMESKRYGVEIAPEQREVLDHKPTPADFHRFAVENIDTLKQHPDVKIGWDTLGGKPEMNIGVSTDNLDAAKNIGAKLDQRSVWDTQKQEEVPTGGKGEQREFPDYPMSARLADLDKGNLTKDDDFTVRGETANVGPAESLTNPKQFRDKIQDVSTLSPREQVAELTDMLDRARRNYSESTRQKANYLRDYWRGNVNIVKDALEAARIAATEQKKVDQRHASFVSPGEPIPSNPIYQGPRSPINKQAALNTYSPIDLDKGNLKSPKGSSVPLMEEPLEVEGTGEKGRISTLDVAQALNEYSKEKNPALQPGAEPEEMVKRAKKIAEDEAKYQMASGKTGTAWYTDEMKDHDKALTEGRPELLTGENIDTPTPWPHTAKLSIFKAAEAILSSGQKPYGNFKSAVKAWDAYNETGEFPRLNPATGKSWGPRGEAAYGNALDMLNHLIKDKGEKGAAEWLLNDHPVSELKQYKPKGVKGAKNDMRPGAIILGEKRGPFMQNLHGIEAAFTADMWVSRTWNRWMGTMEFGKDKDGEMEIKSDSPRNGAERDLMKKSFAETAQKLGLTTSSLQAVLWYYEQALYTRHGIPKESWSFRDAAQRAMKEAAMPPEAEQTGFNFGANEKPASQGGLNFNAKEKGGLGNLGNIPVVKSKFVDFNKPIGGVDKSPLTK
jgi:hypothetical protein